MLRSETRTRARALQLLYAWELRGRPSVRPLAIELAAWDPRRAADVEAAETVAFAVADAVSTLDDEIGQVADNWRLDRIGVVERNILRLAVHELHGGNVPARVAINEAVRLAHWFAGAKAPAFVNGVLDSIARQRGLL